MSPIIAKPLPSRAVIAEALRRFRVDGVAAEPVVFGADHKPEAVMIPFGLYVDLLDAIEDVQIAHLLRVRSAAGSPVPLADVAAGIGLNPASYR